MTEEVRVAVGLVVSYLLGAVPVSFLVAKLGRGIDLRQRGSGNLGATNVYRTLGWRYAVPVGLFDVAKGAVPAAFFGGWFGGPGWAPVAYGTAAVLGHVFSVYVGFRGGKGVATAAGVLLVLAPGAVLVAIPVWIGVLALTGYVSLSSVVSAALFPVILRFVAPEAHALFWASVLLAGLIIVKHRSNLQRLLAGTESRFGHPRVGG